MLKRINTTVIVFFLLLVLSWQLWLRSPFILNSGCGGERSIICWIGIVEQINKWSSSNEMWQEMRVCYGADWVIKGETDLQEFCCIWNLKHVVTSVMLQWRKKWDVMSFSFFEKRKFCDLLALLFFVSFFWCPWFIIGILMSLDKWSMRQNPLWFSSRKGKGYATTQLNSF